MRKSLVASLLGMALGAFAAGAAAADGLLKQKPGEVEFLPVDEAFEIQPLVRLDDGAVEVSWRIAPDYYLYRDKLKFAVVAPASLQLGSPDLPASLPHEDEHFGTTQIYRDWLAVRVPVANQAKGKVALKVTYQGCADAGLCYPPQTRTLEAAR